MLLTHMKTYKKDDLVSQKFNQSFDVTESSDALISQINRKASTIEVFLMQTESCNVSNYLKDSLKTVSMEFSD